MSRRRAGWIAVAAAFAMTSLPAAAQTYPQRLVKLVVPQAPGGTTDVLARAMGERLSKRWNQPVVVENVAGAAGNVGTGQVARATPDGYTLLVTYEGSQAINPHLYTNQTFDSVKDFQAIATFSRGGFYVVVGPKFPAADFKAFLKSAKESTKPYNYATSGVGSVNHIIGEMIKAEAGIELVHVAHRGIAQAITNIAGGHVEAGVVSVGSVIGQVLGGEIRALAITSAERTSVTPDVPTLAEQGLPGFDINPWWGLLGPAGMDPALVAKINADVNEILKDPEMRAFMGKIGAEPYATEPARFQAIMVENVKRWGEILKKTGVKPQ